MSNSGNYNPAGDARHNPNKVFKELMSTELQSPENSNNVRDVKIETNENILVSLSNYSEATRKLSSNTITYQNTPY